MEIPMLQRQFHHKIACEAKQANKRGQHILMMQCNKYLILLIVTTCVEAASFLPALQGHCICGHERSLIYTWLC